jgi:dynein heavy chain
MMLFEGEDLAVASPATVSRCGMVYMESNQSFRYLFDSWTLLMHPDLQKVLDQTLSHLFDDYFVPALKYMRENLNKPMRNSNIVQSFFRIIHSIIFPLYSQDSQERIKDDILQKIHSYLPKYFWFALIWSIGSTTDNE